MIALYHSYASLLLPTLNDRTDPSFQEIYSSTPSPSPTLNKFGLSCTKTMLTMSSTEYARDSYASLAPISPTGFRMPPMISCPRSTYSCVDLQHHPQSSLSLNDTTPLFGNYASTSLSAPTEVALSAWFSLSSRCRPDSNRIAVLDGTVFSGSSADASRWRYATFSASSTPPYIASSTFV